MEISDIPFGTTDWSKIERTEHKGETGSAYWRTRQFGSIRVRMVEYTPGYLADHWCEKGHILLCVEGELETELADAGTTVLRPTRKGEKPQATGKFFKPLRQIIESINDTLKGQLDLELPGGRTPAGVCVRIAQRILALTAAIWHNDNLGLNIRRSLTAYDH